MNDKPALSVLIPWCQRDELKRTLAENAPAFREQQAEVLLLNCGGDSGRLHDLIAASEVPCVRQLDISAPRFSRSLALNIGLSHSSSDTIFVLDADIIVGSALRNARMLPDDRTFVTIEWMYESEPSAVVRPKPGDIDNRSAMAPALEYRFRNGITVRHELSHRDAFGNRRGCAGLLLAKKCDLLEVQGYNSTLEGWGGEDDDIAVRLQYVLGLRRVQRGAVLHLTHGDDRRAVKGPRPKWQVNFLRCCRNYNNGLFLGTYCADVAWAADKVTETPTQQR